MAQTYQFDPPEHWSESRKANFEYRSCLRKIRYKIEPTCTLDQYAYPCRYCGGWHKASKRAES